MKICQILFRGIEGCGVTLYTMNASKFLNSRNIENDILYNTDKKWARSKSHNTNNLRGFSFEKNTIEQIVDMINEYDIVIIDSLLHSSQKEYFEKYEKVIEQINSYIVFIQHEFTWHAINRSLGVDSISKRADLVFVHSVNGYAAKRIRRDCYPIINGFEFEETKKKHWKDISEKNIKDLKWIGRDTSRKGPEDFMRFSKVVPNDYYMSMEGMTRGIYIVSFQEKFDFNDYTRPADVKKQAYKPTNNGKVDIFGGYIKDEMVDRMSRCGFGFVLNKFNPEDIQHSLEFGHMEVIAAGTIPVFHDVYGENCIHRKTGRKLKDHRYTGTLWLNDSNHADVMEQVNKIANDPVLYEETREKAFLFYSNHLGFDKSFFDFFGFIKKKHDEFLVK